MAAIQTQINLLPLASPELAIANWVLHNLAFKIYDMKQLQGGWEGWLQIELALYLSAPGVLQQSREERNIWQGAGQDAVDLWFQRIAGTVALYSVGIELKCRTRRENHTTFKTRFIADCAKIERALDQNAQTQVPMQQNVNRRPADMYAIAITDDLADVQGYQHIPQYGNLQNLAGWPIQYVNLHPGWQGMGPWYMIWRNVYIP